MSLSILEHKIQSEDQIDGKSYTDEYIYTLQNAKG